MLYFPAASSAEKQLTDVEALMDGVNAFGRYYLNWEIIKETLPLLLRTLDIVVELLVLSMFFSGMTIPMYRTTWSSSS